MELSSLEQCHQFYVNILSKVHYALANGPLHSQEDYCPARQKITFLFELSLQYTTWQELDISKSHMIVQLFREVNPHVPNNKSTGHYQPTHNSGS